MSNSNLKVGDKEVTLLKLAISGDGEFVDLVEASSFRGIIHSVFNSTLNIQNQDGDELFTIACKKLDNGPNTIIIDLESLHNTGIDVKELVCISGKSMYIGKKLTISFENIRRWESKLPEYPNTIEVANRNLSFVKDYIEVHGRSGGVKIDFASDHVFAKEVSRMIAERSQHLQQALLNGSSSSALEYAQSLIGLGPGLTPSGDDFLVGFFTAINVRNSPLSSYQSFCGEVVQKAKALTNNISFMALKKASIGKVRESIIQLVSSILSGDRDELILSLNKVLHIGSSSGTDIALGLVSGMEANIKAGGKL